MKTEIYYTVVYDFVGFAAEKFKTLDAAKERQKIRAAAHPTKFNDGEFYSGDSSTICKETITVEEISGTHVIGEVK